MTLKRVYKSVLSLGLLILISTTLSAFTENLRVSLLTQDEGDEMYAYFGHTAIRVTDDSLNVDVVYNYGTFDFNTPNFYMRFVKGDLDYCLSIDDFDYFVYFSKETKRTIREQELNLTLEEKINLVTALETCYTTSEKYYRYDFLKNNCATKIRDIIEDATNKNIDFNDSGYTGMSFRQLLKPFVAKNYWADFGINLVMGMETDKMASPSDYMFLPIYIHSYLEECDCAEDSVVILDASPEKKSSFDYSYLAPWLIVALLIGLSLWGKSRLTVLYLICILFTLMGSLILFLNVYSLHPALGHNLNVLWTLPAFFVLFFRKKKANDYIKLAYILIITAFIALQGVIPQELSSTFIPWIILAIIVLLLDLDIIQKKSIFIKKI